jgi:hypothetical protein
VAHLGDVEGVVGALGGRVLGAAVPLAGDPQPVHHRAPGPGAVRVVGVHHLPAQDLGQIAPELPQRCRDCHGGEVVGSEDRQQGLHERAELVGGHCRHPTSGEGVVRIIPLGPLGVHPNTRCWNEIHQLGGHDEQQLLGQGGADQIGVGIGEQSPVAAEPTVPLLGEAVGLLVEGHRRPVAVTQPVVVGDSVGHARVDEVGDGEIAGGPGAAQPLSGLDEMVQIDHLVITPVADVRPGVVWFGHFPVHAVGGDAIGVVPVDGHRVEKHPDHRVDQLRVGVPQRLPVLEDVAPVAFEA